MGYSHGRKWTDEQIELSIRQAIKFYGVDGIMPTESKIKEFMGDSSLSNAIAKRGGYRFWANRLNLSLTDCETRFGQELEDYCINDLKSMGYECERMSTKYPYDILAGYVKIDVKVGRLFSGKAGEFYTFNLEKSEPTCDIYVAYCLSENKEIMKTYIIPAVVMQGKTQLSIGKVTSKYDKYIDSWDIIEKYNNFFIEMAV